MTIELRYLTYAAALGLLHLIAASHAISSQYGYRWTASTREQPMPPLKGIANRIDQACTNFLETFPIFAALVMVAHLTGRNGEATTLGARLYFWSRIAYAAASVAGFSLVRSLIWNVALIGMGLFVFVIVWG
jgi:uncharacterized MAPEG superfamily protein